MTKLFLALSIVLFSSPAFAADSATVIIVPPQQQSGNNPNSASNNLQTDSSCARASHKSHDHCPKPGPRIRHDGEVRRNGRIINEIHGTQQ